MKRIVTTFLCTSFALINFAAAQDDERPAPVDRNNVARRQAPPQAPRSIPQQAQRPIQIRQPQTSFRGPQNTGVSPRFDSGIRNQPGFGGQRFNGNATRFRTSQPPVPTAGISPQTNVGVPTTPVLTRTPLDRRNRGGRNDWRNRTMSPTADQNLAGRMDRNGDLRNRGNRTGNNTAAGNVPTTDPATREAIDQDRLNRTGNAGNDGSAAGTAAAGRGGHRGFHDRHEGDPNFRQEHHRYHERHDRNWWRSRYNQFALFGGGYYYLNSGYWYPAYGYDPFYTTYTYDAPIYSYNDQQPEQVMSDVQAELARRGYYYGAIDGTYGPQTREALLRYQRDNGLEITGMIDQATLESLGYQ